jgi:hypothetical protein
MLHFGWGSFFGRMGGSRERVQGREGWKEDAVGQMKTSWPTEKRSGTVEYSESKEKRRMPGKENTTSGYFR